MRIYTGIRDRAGVNVWRAVQGAPRARLHPDASRRLYDHSPTGFEWGYGGSGPSQLALALILDFTKNEEWALAMHHLFKEEVVARMPRRQWELTGAEIQMWLDDNKKAARYFAAKWDGAREEDEGIEA